MRNSLRAPHSTERLQNYEYFRDYPKILQLFLSNLRIFSGLCSIFFQKRLKTPSYASLFLYFFIFLQDEESLHTLLASSTTPSLSSPVYRNARSCE